MVEKLAPGRYYGFAGGRREVAGITFCESAYPPDAALPAHRHEHAFFYLVVEGRCTEACGRSSATGGPSTLVYHPPGEVHANRWPGPGGRCFHVELSHARLEAARPHAPALGRPFRLAGGPASLLALRLLGEFRLGELASPLALEGLALELLAETSRAAEERPGAAAPRWLLRVRDRLHDRFAEDYHLGELAAEGGVHPAHLARCFRRHFRCTPGEYIRRLRVEDACRRLAGSDEPLVSVALAAGYADQAHFTKAFRRATGLTPAEYRRATQPRKPGTS
jgi:AraC family transcriptional regulator